MGHATPFAQVFSDQLGIPFEKIRCCRATATSCRGRRLRRLEVDHAHRHRDRRSRGQGDREGQADRGARARSRAVRHRVRARATSPSSAPTAPSGSWNWRRSCTAASSCRPTRRNRSTSRTSATDRAPRPFPTAATSPRSRSIRKPASSRSSKYSCVNDFGTVINPMIVDGQLHGGVVQGIGQALMENDGLRRRRPAAHRLVHGLRHAARRRRAARSRSPTIRRRPRPIRSASRAAARPAAPARSPR